jgi:CheY-like chemotaxis protein
MTDLEANVAIGTTGAARVLVVDDSDTTRELVARILRRDGHIVLQAANGREALRLLRTTRADLVLTDLFMPDMDGIELLRALAMQAPDLPVVVLSGADAMGPGSLLGAATMLGAAAALSKPVTPEALRAAVRVSLATHRPMPPARDAA